MRNSNWPIILILLSFNHLTYAATYDATIDFSSRIKLSLPVSGVIKTITAVPGQQVARGDVLMTLDQAPFQTAVTLAEANVTIRQSLLNQSLRDLNHLQMLYDETVLSTTQLENAKHEVKRNTAYLKRANAELSTAQYKHRYSNLTSPFDALVLLVHVNEGQFIINSLQNTVLISLVKRNQYHAEFFIPIDKTEKLKIGGAATVNFQGDDFSGKIVSIHYAQRKNDTTKIKGHKVRVNFESNKSPLAVGHKASVHIN